MSKQAIFLSDLHLGCGDELEDFPMENETALAQFIDHQSELLHHQNVELVFLGDFLDIWQATDDAEKSAQESTDISIDLTENDQLRRERKIIQAHPLAFDRLNAFLESDPDRRRLIFLVGNHDHSLVCKDVQNEVRVAVTAGDVGISSLVEFRTFYDEPELRTYAEHGNQYDTYNEYEDFVQFGNECPGHYFVRLFWNRLEWMEPNLDVWWKCFQAIWHNKLWQLLKPAVRLFHQYRADPRPFERINVPGVPFFAAQGAPGISTTGNPLSGYPDVLLSDSVRSGRVFSMNNETENLLRSLYHDSANYEFRDWVDQTLREKHGGRAPLVPSTRLPNASAYGIFQDENVAAVAGMFARTDEAPRTHLLRGSALDDNAYDYVIFGHTHEEKRVSLERHNATYFNTGTWSARRDPKGANISRFCFVKITKGDDDTISAVQDFWQPTG